MAKNMNITIPLESLNAGIKKYILVKKTAVFQYEAGKRTSDTPMAYKYIVALQGTNLMPVDVRIDGPDTLEEITNEEIQDQTSKCQFIFVEFVDAVAKVYTINGEQRISASAKSAILVDYI